MYDHDLLDVEWNDEEQQYDVWYDGVFLGLARTYRDAHYLAVNYVVR